MNKIDFLFFTFNEYKKEILREYKKEKDHFYHRYLYSPSFLKRKGDIKMVEKHYLKNDKLTQFKTMSISRMILKINYDKDLRPLIVFELTYKIYVSGFKVSFITIHISEIEHSESSLKYEDVEKYEMFTNMSIPVLDSEKFGLAPRIWIKAEKGEIVLSSCDYFSGSNNPDLLSLVIEKYFDISKSIILNKYPTLIQLRERLKSVSLAIFDEEIKNTKIKS